MLNNNFQNILIKFGLWLGFLIVTCIIGITGVFAYTYQDIGYLSSTASVNVTTNYYEGLLNIPKDRYLQLEGVYSLDVFVSNINWEANKTYQIELNLPGTTLNSNANTYRVENILSNGTEVCSNETGTIYDGNYPKFYFKCNSPINEFYLRIYNSNNQYILPTGEFRWNYVYGRIRLNTDTEDIINNQNQNTQDIINNQNANTDKEIESQQVCSTIYIDKNSIILKNNILSTVGQVLSTSATWGVTDFYQVSSLSTLNVIQSFNSSTSNQCFYDENKLFISCFIANSTGNITIPNNAKYVRFSVSNINNLPQLELKNCKNGNQALNDSIEEQTNSINGLKDDLNDDDTSGASSEFSDFFSSFNTDTFGLTSIITAPLNLIQSLTSSSCTLLHLPLPYLNNKYLDLPCMTTIYQTHFGAFFTMYQTITYGIIAYWVCVRIFNQVKDFKNPEHDEIEVVDL